MTAFKMRRAVDNIMSACAQRGIPVDFKIRCAAEILTGQSYGATTSARVLAAAQSVYGKRKPQQGPQQMGASLPGRVYNARNLEIADRMLTAQQKSGGRNV